MYHQAIQTGSFSVSYEVRYALDTINQVIDRDAQHVSEFYADRITDLSNQLNAEWDAMQAMWPALGALGLLQR